MARILSKSSVFQLQFLKDKLQWITEIKVWWAFEVSLRLTLNRYGRGCSLNLFSSPNKVKLNYWFDQTELCFLGGDRLFSLTLLAKTFIVCNCSQNCTVWTDVCAWVAHSSVNVYVLHSCWTSALCAYAIFQVAQELWSYCQIFQIFPLASATRIHSPRTTVHQQRRISWVQKHLSLGEHDANH